MQTCDERYNIIINKCMSYIQMDNAYPFINSTYWLKSILKL